MWGVSRHGYGNCSLNEAATDRPRGILCKQDYPPEASLASGLMRFFTRSTSLRSEGGLAHKKPVPPKQGSATRACPTPSLSVHIQAPTLPPRPAQEKTQGRPNPTAGPEPPPPNKNGPGTELA